MIVGSEYYRYGKRIKYEVEQKIRGRYTMGGHDAGAISFCVAMCPGDHIEIGTLYGGSAIVAALAKKEAGQTGMVYGVDPFGWFEGQSKTTPSGEPLPEPCVDVVMANAKLFGVEDRIKVLTASHPPLPEELECITFDTAFIDGNHSYEGAKDDWDNLKNRVRKYVLFHDITLAKYADHRCGKVFREAQEEGWKSIYVEWKMGVLERE